MAQPWPKEGISLRRLALAGLFLGAATMVRPIVLVVPIVLFLYWLWVFPNRARVLAQVGVILLVFAAIIVPWTIRNVISMHAFVLVSTNSGDDFCIGNHEGATGQFVFAGPCYEGFEDTTDRRELEIDGYREGIRRGFEFILKHPADELGLIFEKAYYLVYRDDDGLIVNESYGDRFFIEKEMREYLSTAANAYYFVTIGWAGLGLLSWFRRRDPRRTFFVIMLGCLLARSSRLLRRYPLPLPCDPPPLHPGRDRCHGGLAGERAPVAERRFGHGLRVAAGGDIQLAGSGQVLPLIPDAIGDWRRTRPGQTTCNTTPRRPVTRGTSGFGPPGGYLRRRPHLLWLAAIAVLAMALRLAWIAYANPSPYDGRIDDCCSLIRRPVAGGGEGVQGSLPCIRPPSGPPATPLLLAGFYKVLGHDVMLAKLLNVLAGGAACVLIYARRREGVQPAGRVACGAHPRPVPRLDLLLHPVDDGVHLHRHGRRSCSCLS